MKFVVAALSLSALLGGLVGCADRSGTSAEVVASSLPKPEGACPYPNRMEDVSTTSTSGMPASSTTTEPCVRFNPDEAMGDNEAYRQRGDVAEQYREQLEQHRLRIEALLRDALAAEASLDGDEVITLLKNAGYSSVNAYGRSNEGGGVGFGVSTGSGCVFGQIKGSEVIAEAGGGIADGGCLPAQGH